MISLTNGFHHFFYKTISIVFTALFSIYSISGGINKEPPEAPDNFTPVLRFTVCSDIHLDGETDQANAKRFAKLFTNSYKYSEKHKNYNCLDAVIVCGDMTNEGKPQELQMYSDIIKNNIREGTEILQCMGNHEFINERNSQTESAINDFKEFVTEETETHTVINGYHFIGISYSDKDENFGDKIKWLDEQIKIAISEDKNKPVFVFQHTHPTLTVYGSIHWSNIDISKVLRKYPQVVDFSGHSHYASVDPRTVWQGSFTAIGTGAITGLMSNLDYINGDAYSQFRTGSYNIVEVDADGNIRLQVYDCVTEKFFENGDYYFPNPTNKKNRIHNWTNKYSLDTKPQFPDNAEIVSEINNDGETVIYFPRAIGYFEAESYKLIVSKDKKKIKQETVLSNYILADGKDMWINLGVLEEGVYNIKIKPSSPYAKQGKSLKGSITV